MDSDWSIYKSESCVFRLDYANDETPSSYVTPVGSSQVQNRLIFSMNGADELIQCNSVVCPGARTGTNGMLVNMAHPVLMGGWGWVVSKTTVRINEVWKMLEFLMQEKCTFNVLLQGMASPWLISQYNVTKWEYFALEGSPALTARVVHDSWPSKFKSSLVTNPSILKGRRDLISRQCDGLTTEGPMCMSKYLNGVFQSLRDTNSMSLYESRKFSHPMFSKLDGHLIDLALMLTVQGMSLGQTVPEPQQVPADQITFINGNLTTLSHLITNETIDPARGNQILGITKSDLISSYRRIFRTPDSPRSTDGACPPGYYLSGAGGFSLSCVPCPSGFYGNQTYGVDNTCSHCPRGTYQPNPGAVICNNCPRLKTTLRTGSKFVEDCSVPYLEVDPQIALTPVDVLWAVENIQQVDDESKEIAVTLWMISAWRDDRIIQTVEDGVSSLSSDQWKERGFWLPEFSLESEVYTSMVQDTIEITRKDKGGGNIIGEINRISLVSAVVKLGDIAENTERQPIQGLTWFMFPFGKQTLDLRITCPSEAVCSCTSCEETQNDTTRRRFNEYEQDGAETDKRDNDVSAKVSTVCRPDMQVHLERCQWCSTNHCVYSYLEIDKPLRKYIPHPLLLPRNGYLDLEYVPNVTFPRSHAKNGLDSQINRKWTCEL